MNYIKYIDDNLLEKTYQGIINEIKLIEEIFFIRTKNNKFIIVENGSDLIKNILTNKIKPYKKYYKYDIIVFCNNIKRDTCKYQTFHKYKVYKYDILNNLYINKIKNGKKLPSYLVEFENIMKNSEIQKYFRIKKFKNILK